MMSRDVPDGPAWLTSTRSSRSPATPPPRRSRRPTAAWPASRTPTPTRTTPTPRPVSRSCRRLRGAVAIPSKREPLRPLRHRRGLRPRRPVRVGRRWTRRPLRRVLRCGGPFGGGRARGPAGPASGPGPRGARPRSSSPRPCSVPDRRHGAHRRAVRGVRGDRCRAGDRAPTTCPDCGGSGEVRAVRRHGARPDRVRLGRAGAAAARAR